MSVAYAPRAESLAIDAMERGWVPDSVIRAGIRKFCKRRLEQLELNQPSSWIEELDEYVGVLKHSPIAIHTREANQQHYELPAEYFELVLGSQRKYSSCFFDPGVTDLSTAEVTSLNTAIDRAQISDGMRILELGCGWGSATVHLAKRFPRAKIVALSNSTKQRQTILKRLAESNLTNVEVLTGDISQVIDQGLHADHIQGGSFDRVFSIEMFEHVRNYHRLFKWISSVLRPEGKLFFHVFAHRLRPYFFETDGEDNWMGKYFFTGGQMPSPLLFGRFQDDLRLAHEWWWPGTHYEKTSNEWLKRHDSHQEKIKNIFKQVYGDQADLWFQRWRIFYMACAELFGYAGGSEWGVLHCLFEKAK